MKLVITEKPSVAMSIAKVIGAGERRDGWTDVGLLAGIEVSIILIIFAATWLTEFLLDITASLSGFLHA